MLWRISHECKLFNMVSFDPSFRVTFLLREVITVVQAEERILANWRSPENVEMEQLARKRERKESWQIAGFLLNDAIWTSQVRLCKAYTKELPFGWHGYNQFLQHCTRIRVHTTVQGWLDSEIGTILNGSLIFRSWIEIDHRRKP